MTKCFDMKNPIILLQSQVEITLGHKLDAFEAQQVVEFNLDELKAHILEDVAT